MNFSLTVTACVAVDAQAPASLLRRALTLGAVGSLASALGGAPGLGRAASAPQASGKKSASKVPVSSTKPSSPPAPRPKAVNKPAAAPKRLGPPVLVPALAVYPLGSRQAVVAHGQHEPRPIASLTKLMTAMVVFDRGLPAYERVRIEDADVDRLKHSTSRLPVGARPTRSELLQLSLAVSDNRAAHALARAYPGGVAACVRDMNQKAQRMGLRSAHFVEPTGLSAANVCSAADLAQLLQAFQRYALLSRYSTQARVVLEHHSQQLTFRNTNRLLREEPWAISASKTGYIHEAGRCLSLVVLWAGVTYRVIILGADSSETRWEQVRRLQQWLAQARPR